MKSGYDERRVYLFDQVKHEEVITSKDETFAVNK